jgi:2-polyprenyl-3-methyl-5-hydroxy-6-metoxy-1,4-benzoquinol methylase
VPADALRVLDVGCGDGTFAARLRERAPDMTLIGIDPLTGDDEPFDQRITGFYPQDMPASDPFDCVVFNDVLEHNSDPNSILRATTPLIAPGGRLVASIPNVRHFHVLVPLVLHGRFDYRPIGILATDHVRFFTRATMLELFDDSGYTVDRQAPINVTTDGKRGLANRLAGGRLIEFVAPQYVVVAHPTQNGSST